MVVRHEAFTPCQYTLVTSKQRIFMESEWCSLVWDQANESSYFCKYMLITCRTRHTMARTTQMVLTDLLASNSFITWMSKQHQWHCLVSSYPYVYEASRDARWTPCVAVSPCNPLALGGADCLPPQGSKTLTRFILCPCLYLKGVDFTTRYCGCKPVFLKPSTPVPEAKCWRIWAYLSGA